MDKEEKTEEKSVDVAHQYKDLSSKFMASMRGHAFADALEIDMEPLERNEPTELPIVEVSNMMMDNLFLLRDGSYAIIDYESKYSEENKIKYLNYLARLVKSLYNRNKRMPRIQIIVIYTADIKAGSTNPTLDLGNVVMTTQEVFLTSWDTEKILEDIDRKVDTNEPLDEREMVQLIMVPLSTEGKDAKQEVIRRCIDTIEKVSNGELQQNLYGGLLAFTDKVIDAKDQEEIRRRLSMTKIEKMFYDEKMEALSENTEKIAANLLKDGLSTEMVSRNTGLDLSAVEELAEKIAKEKMQEPMSV